MTLSLARKGRSTSSQSKKTSALLVTCWNSFCVLQAQRLLTLHEPCACCRLRLRIPDMSCALQNSSQSSLDELKEKEIERERERSILGNEGSSSSFQRSPARAGQEPGLVLVANP